MQTQNIYFNDSLFFLSTKENILKIIIILQD